ncbi:MAG TPA: CDP-archaeol synthase [Candidatus Saccharimonadales bacterium]|nr:CDP-archaeol synthase [Candidatus Saccharimonadales bacterium]
MLRDVFFALWFFLPAAAANVMPILVAPLPGLRQWQAPMDFGFHFRGKRILGAHKTWRGLIAGLLASTLALWLQQLLIAHWHPLHTLTAQVDYVHLPTLILGPLFGLGALGGDAIESFFKRQRGVAPGQGWFPFDQTDYIIGGAVATLPFVTLTLWQYMWLIVLWLAVHVVASYIGYLLKLKERPI